MTRPTQWGFQAKPCSSCPLSAIEGKVESVPVFMTLSLQSLPAISMLTQDHGAAGPSAQAAVSP